MRVRLASAAAALLCGCLLIVPTRAGAKATAVQLDMLRAVNEVRAQHGMGRFRGTRTLHRSARDYARWMLRADYFGHLSRIRASSRFSVLGEALAWHSGWRPPVSHTVRVWMRSAPHRALILHPGFHWLGAGMARGSLSGRGVTVWVLHFGGSLGAALAPQLDVALPVDTGANAPVLTG